ncbi:M1 family metallopeptidase [Nocardioides stalactiti]|uniref:M1 family metallopeptidase n=1 Tax=Nocardioides stalactiti TaxID=2755356 RepID=UPI0016017592|nr:M1 family metallopeptidase [Nocardioides stalactiti]
MPRLSRVLSLFSIGLVGAVATGSIAVSAPAVAPQVPDPYYPMDGNVGYDVQHYDIHDTYRFGDGHLSGTTTVTLVPSVRLTSFNLDLLLAVDSVLVDGVEAEFDKPNKHELTVTPPGALPAGTPVEVTVAYQGVPADLDWNGESNWLADDREVVLMNEPHMAAWWFPSNDHPSDKATYDIRVTTAAGREVISNGVRVGRTVDGDQATTHWRMAQPMTTYLAFFAAGDFAIESGRAHGIRYYNAVSEQLGASETKSNLDLMRQSARITAWLQDELGDYPFATTGGVVTGLDVGFALENQSRPTYPANMPLTIVVHEIAHQWFGDSVSVARWRDIWINEGFASYMEWRWREVQGGATTNRTLRDYYSYYKDVRGFWRLNIANPGPALHNLFNTAVYDRGAMTLAALRNKIGRADFRRLLRRWVDVNRADNATSEQFEAMAETVSGKELDRFFQVWLRADGVPPNKDRFGL